MAYQINFSVTSESFYSSEEKAELIEALKEFMVGADDEVNLDSATLEVVDLSNVEPANAKKQAEIREAAAGLIANGIIQVDVRVLDLNEDVIHEAELSTDN